MLVSLYPDQIRQAPQVQGVYVITHEPTGKVYVGIGANIAKRWGHHLSRLRQGCHSNRFLQSAWNASEPTDFQFNVLEIISDAEGLRTRENFWISLFDSHTSKSGFNIVTHSRTPQTNPIGERQYASAESLSELRVTLESETSYLGTSPLARRFDCSVNTVIKYRRQIRNDRPKEEVISTGAMLGDWMTEKIPTTDFQANPESENLSLDF